MDLYQLNYFVKVAVVSVCIHLHKAVTLLDAGSGNSLVGVDVNHFPFGMAQQFTLVPFNLVFVDVIIVTVNAEKAAFCIRIGVNTEKSIIYNSVAVFNLDDVVAYTVNILGALFEK